VRAGILGDNAEIGAEVSNDEGVAMQYDFRDVYGTVFEDWFDLEPEVVKQVLSHDYVHLPILEGCDATSTEDNPIVDLRVKFWPNPMSAVATLSFDIDSGYATVLLNDASGRLLDTLLSRALPAGEHQFSLDLSQYPAGIYFVRLSVGASVATRRIIKQ
ncbi:MAG: T9SS type A sorting domain-containing protein, partial [Bacteroidota bacterium]